MLSVDKLPKGIKKNLSPGEEIILHLKTFTIFEKPDYIVLTNIRVLAYNEKWIGYEFQSIPFQKLLEMKASRGIFFWGDISVKSEEKISTEDKEPIKKHVTYLFRRVNRKYIEDFVNAMETAVNKIAVEPITIKSKKFFLGIASWSFSKPEELLFRQQLPVQTVVQEDPLVELKMRFIRGEITEEDYKARLRVLKES